MAKKSVKIGLRSGTTVESGDVNVTYNGVRIAGLSESTTATLQTENTIVEHDIEIEYTRPEGSGTEITFNVYSRSYDADTGLNDDETLVTSVTGDIGTVYLIPFSIGLGSPDYEIIAVSDDLQTTVEIPFKKITVSGSGFNILIPNLPEMNCTKVYITWENPGR